MAGHAGRLITRGLRSLGWSPMTLRYRSHDISSELRNFNISVFPSSGPARFDTQGDVMRTKRHLHYSLGLLRSGNRHTGVSIMFLRFSGSTLKTTAGVTPGMRVFHLGPRRLRFDAPRSRLEFTSDDLGRPGDRVVTGELRTRPRRAKTRPARP